MSDPDFDRLAENRRAETVGSVPLPTAEFDAKNASLLDQAVLAVKFFPAFTDDQRLGILKNHFGDDLKVDQDNRGNVILEYKGERGWLNKPGASVRDAMTFVNGAIQFLPAAKAGAAVVSNMVGRGIQAGRATSAGAAATGLASGATSIGLDAASMAAGSDVNPDLTAAGMTAITAGVFEKFSPILARMFRHSPDEMIISGELTPMAVEAMEGIGIDPSTIGAELSRAFAEQAAAGTRSAGGTAMAAAASRFRTPISRGEAAQDFGQMASEENLRFGGTFVGEPLRAQTARQTQRFIDVAGDLERNAAQGPASVRSAGATVRPVQATESENVGQLVRGISGRATAARNEIRSAYQELELLPIEQRPAIQAEHYADVLNTAEKMIARREITATTHPLTSKAMKNLRRTRQALNKRGGKVRPVDLINIEAQRRSLNSMIKSAETGSADERGLLAIKRGFDDAISEAIDEGLFSGDPAVIEILLRARNLRTSYGNNFERAGQQGQQASSSSARATARTMRIFAEAEPEPEEALNYLFGKSAIGFKAETGRTVRHIVTTFGRESEEVAILREGVIKRMFRNVLPSDVSPTSAAPRAGFNRGTFRTNVDKMFSEAPTVMRELFDPEELAEIRAFSRLVSGTAPPPGVANPSGSGFKIMQGLAQLGRVLSIAPLAGAGAAVGGNQFDSGTATALGIGTIIAGLAGRGIGWKLAARRAGGVPARPTSRPPVPGFSNTSTAIVRPAFQTQQTQQDQEPQP